MLGNVHREPWRRVSLAEGPSTNGVLWLPMRLTLVLLLLAASSASSGQQSTTPTADDYSGLYSFLRDGEFIQISVEDQGKVSGFISRYGDSDNDKDTFLDQFFESGNLEKNRLAFKTKEVHGTRFTFEGTIERGTAKAPDQEGYYVIRGTLTRWHSDVDKKITQSPRGVELKSFPKE